MKVEILHIEECSHWERAGTVIEEALSELGASDVSPKFVLIRTPEEAGAVPFAGSPTILIDGVDPFPGGFRTTDLACRIYRDGQRMAGVPSRESLRQVLADALASRAAADELAATKERGKGEQDTMLPAMTFEELCELARKVAQELVPQVSRTENPDGIEGWLLHETDTRETTLLDRGRVEQRFETDQVWLRTDGALLLNQVLREPGRNSDYRQATSVLLTETYARKVDGTKSWETWQEIGGFTVPSGTSRRDREERDRLTAMRGTTHQRDVGEGYWQAPSPDQPPFSRVAGWLAAVRP